MQQERELPGQKLVIAIAIIVACAVVVITAILL